MLTTGFPRRCGEQDKGYGMAIRLGYEVHRPTLSPGCIAKNKHVLSILNWSPVARDLSRVFARGR